MRRLLLLAFIWGWSFLFIKVAVEGMTPPTVAFLRIALGAAALQGWLRWRGVPPVRDRRVWWWGAAVGLVGSAVPFTLLAWGEERISSALTAVLNASTPLFTAMAAALLVGERLRRWQVGGLLVGIVGVAVAAGLGASDLSGSSLAGSLASVGAGACYGLAFVWMRQHLVGVPPASAAAIQLTTAAALMAPIALATSVAGGFDPTWRRIGAVLLLGVVGTGFAYLLNYRVVADLGATRASLVTYIIPAVAVLVGVVVLDEEFHARILLGGVLIIGGIALVNGAQLLRRPPATVAGAAVVVALLGLAGCGGDDAASAGGGCGRERREALDPSTAVHVLAGGDEPAYRTDPPTSGPHEPGLPLSGVLDEPLSRPAQVGALEAGGVLVQHRDLDDAELTALADVAGEGVAVAPNPDLPERVVATAWLFKLSCDGVDVDAIEAFVDAHRGEGPGSDG